MRRLNLIFFILLFIFISLQAFRHEFYPASSSIAPTKSCRFFQLSEEAEPSCVDDSFIPRRVICSLITNENYLTAALVLGHSLTDVGTEWPLALLLTEDIFASPSLLRLAFAAGWEYVQIVDRIANPLFNDSLLNDSRMAAAVQDHKSDVLTKLRLFQLVSNSFFQSLVFIDSDAVVMQNIDHLLELPVPKNARLGLAPEVTPLWRCIGEGERFIFKDALGGSQPWCHGHTKEPYHGRIFPLSNSGVMLLERGEQSQFDSLFDSLLSLARAEPSYNDTCLGRAGCNDQRIINMLLDQDMVAKAAHSRLSIYYNVFCDQYLSGDASAFENEEGIRPFIFHYRGSRFKPWVLSGPNWSRKQRKEEKIAEDPCLAFTSHHDNLCAKLESNLKIKHFSC